MTAVADHQVTRAMRRAAVAALRAPSVHNTQPWRFVLRRGAFEVHADRSRQLHVLDPRGRQLMISCGCAVMNARVAFAAAGLEVDVLHHPDPMHPEVLARLIPVRTASVQSTLAKLEPALEIRRTNRRRFDGELLADEVVDQLCAAASAEGAELFPIRTEDDRLTTARLSQMADRIENSDPAYRAELRAWTTDDPRRDDGVQAFSVPHVDGNAHDDVPIRDFDTTGMGWLPSHTESSSAGTLLLLGTDGDDPPAWVHAGEALERVLLHLTVLGYAASPLTQVIEVPHTNALLRSELRLTMHPHVLLRVGRAPETLQTRRRRLADVLIES